MMNDECQMMQRAFPHPKFSRLQAPEEIIEALPLARPMDSSFIIHHSSFRIQHSS
jgi:hypothetical protein